MIETLWKREAYPLIVTECVLVLASIKNLLKKNLFGDVTPPLPQKRHGNNVRGVRRRGRERENRPKWTY